MQLIDCHSHSALSGHGQGTPTQMVERAVERGLAVYAQTEHYPLPAELDPERGDSLVPEQVEDYRAEVERARGQLAREGRDLELLCGVELDWLDWLPGHARELERACGCFEYTLASVHFVEGLAVDNDDDLRLWERHGVDGVWERYLTAWEHLVRSGLPFTTLAHPDLPKVLGQLPSFDLREPFGDLAALVAAQGYLIEVNTAGWRKSVGEQYPTTSVLRLFAQAGVPCTVGCDAHRPADVGCDVERAYRVLYEAGYRHVAVPARDGDRRFVELA